jgi:iron(III) transport system substrate-binding protein
VYPVTAYPTGVTIPDGFPEDPNAQLIENDFNWAAKNRMRILEEWTKRFDVKSEKK